MGRVMRATFIDVMADAEEKITKLAEEICCSKEHNLIIEKLEAYVIAPNPRLPPLNVPPEAETKEI